LPGLEEFKVVTPFPAIPEGVGMTCREIEVSDLGSTLVETGRALRDVVELLLGIAP
jgi:hypothetical protein